MRQLSHLLPKNWVVRSPPYFTQDILGMTPKPWNFHENLTSFREIFWIRNYFSSPPLQGVRMLRLYFWVLKGPQLHKKFWAPGASHFGDMGSKVQLSHRLPKNWVGRSPPYFTHGIPGMTPKTLKILWKSRNQFQRYLEFFIY